MLSLQLQDAETKVERCSNVHESWGEVVLWI
jgi:hypothetical protein